MERETYNLTVPQDRKKLHEYFTNFQTQTFEIPTGSQTWTCWIVKSPIGNLNGYVEVGEYFIEWLKNCDYFETISVHGGLTWEGGELKIPEMEGKYVIGFDTAHFMDVLAMDVDPEFIALMPQREDKHYELLNSHKLWLAEDVREELERLTWQLEGLHQKAYPHGR
jgi:hypothetical protein